VTANLRIAESVESLLSYADANAKFELALTEASAFRLSPPSFARIVKFHLPTLLRDAEADDQLLELIPAATDTVGRCRVKLDALALEVFEATTRRTGVRLEMLLTAAFVVAGLRNYLELMAAP
jgi:hypothetical protein